MTERNITCPGCREVVVATMTASGLIGACDACGGQWIDNAASRAILTNELVDAARELVNPRLAAPTAREGGYRQAARMTESSRSCPECNGPLAAHVTEESRFGAAITLDVCAAHGTWFDRGEAWALLQAFAMKRQEISDAMKIAAARNGGPEEIAALVAGLTRPMNE